MLESGEAKSFDIPAFRNALHKHFGREKEFLMLAKYTTSEADMKTQLVDLHARKPNIHKKLVMLLCAASLFKQPDHPRNCSCMLCAHIRRTAPATRVTHSKAQSSASSSHK